MAGDRATSEKRFLKSKLLRRRRSPKGGVKALFSRQGLGAQGSHSSGQCMSYGATILRGKYI